MQHNVEADRHPSFSCGPDHVYANVSGRLSAELAEALKTILVEAKSQRLSDDTVRNRLSQVGRLLLWLSRNGFSKLEDVKPDDLRRYVAEDTRGRNSVVFSNHVLKHCLKATLSRGDLAEAIPHLGYKYRDDFEILTEDDIAAMLKVTDNLQWQLRLLMAYESGARPGEICNLLIRDVRLDQFGAVVTLHGKTLPRTRRLIKCVKLLEKYLHEHPWQDDPEAPLFYGERGQRARMMKDATFRAMVKELAKRAGIKKRVWGHLLRHSAATAEATNFTDAELEELYGWVKGSGMPKRYRHKIDTHKLELKQLRLAGIQVPEEELRSPLAPKKCVRCNAENSPIAKFCSNCNMILDPKEAQKLVAREEHTKGILNALVTDSEFFQMMVRKIKEMGLDSDSP